MQLVETEAIPTGNLDAIPITIRVLVVFPFDLVHNAIPAPQVTVHHIKDQTWMDGNGEDGAVVLTKTWSDYVEECDLIVYFDGIDVKILHAGRRGGLYSNSNNFKSSAILPEAWKGVHLR